MNQDHTDQAQKWALTEKDIMRASDIQRQFMANIMAGRQPHEPKFEYTVDARFIHYPSPANFDSWGLDENGNGWDYSFCIMDDFGTAVPVDPFIYQFEDCTVCLAPDYDNPPPDGEPYKYTVHYPTLH